MQRVDIDVARPACCIVYNVHLGTAILERRHQARRLATIVSRSARERARRSCSATSTSGCAG